MNKGVEFMKFLKKMCSLVLVFAVLLTFLPASIKAASKDEIPTKVRMYPYDWNEEAIQISLADPNQSIKDVKTDNKNISALLTGRTQRLETGTNVEEVSENTFSIGIRAKKSGTYTVSFTIIDEDNKKVADKKVKVYVYDSPIKSVKFDGKEQKNSELSGKSAKVKIALTSGNTIKKLEYGVLKIKSDENSKNTETVYKTFKNGGKVTFGTQAYYYSNENNNEYDDYTYKYNYFNTGMTKPTYIRITYKDKYTKQNEIIEIYYYKVVE